MKTNGAVYRAAYVAVDRAVSGVAYMDMDRAVSDAVYRAVYLTTYRTVCGAVDRAVSDAPEHPALANFLSDTARRAPR